MQRPCRHTPMENIQNNLDGFRFETLLFHVTKVMSSMHPTEFTYIAAVTVRGCYSLGVKYCTSAFSDA